MANNYLRVIICRAKVHLNVQMCKCADMQMFFNYSKIIKIQFVIFGHDLFQKN